MSSIHARNSLVLLVLIAAGGTYAQSADRLRQYVFPDENPITFLVGWRVSWGDSLQWADPSYNDSAWRAGSGVGMWVSNDLPGKGICWYRKRLFIPQPLDTLRRLALYQAAAVTASEIYWDGRLIARNGTVAASAAREEAGRSGQLFVVPRSLTTPGEHVIALSLSNHHTSSGLVEAPLHLGYFGNLHTSLFRRGAIQVFQAGIFFFTALFHLAVLLGYRDRWTRGSFAAFCASCGFYVVILGLRKYFQIDLANYYVLAAVNDIPWFFMMTLLPVFFLFEFSFPRKKTLTIAIAAVALTVIVLARLVTFGIIPAALLPYLLSANQIHVYVTTLIATGVCVWALFQRRSGSLTAIVGSLAFFVGIIVSYELRHEYGWALGFTLLIIFLTISLSRQMAQRNRQHELAQLRSARLELELLKKHIQPHFLLNSLNSIVAWVEEEPQTAGRLVNALAAELRMLLRYAGEKLIPLSEELRLCRTHLEVMSLRQCKEFSLQTRDLRGDERIPPLVIHTLVENGLTHGYGGKDQGTFVLRRENTAEGLRLVLHNDSRVTSKEPSYTEGTGYRYVKTRLEEQYPGKWALDYGPADNGWSVRLELKGVTI